MELFNRRLSRLFSASVVLFLLVAVSCGPDRVTGPTSTLRPGVGLRDAYPDNCTTQAACIGIPGNGVADPEDLEVCKMYPAGTANPPAAVFHLDVVSVYTDRDPSPKHLDYTIQPNTCLVLWFTPGGATQDNYTLTEIVPPGFTATSQITTLVRTSAKGVNPPTYLTTPLPTTSSNPVTGVLGGPNIAGALVTFTNTPVPVLGSIGDFVWHDVNADGIQQSGEAGISGVKKS